MGADLYINKVFDANNNKYKPLFEAAVIERDKCDHGTPEQKKAQELVTKYYNLMYAKGYFRDSYNGTSLFWVMGMSWWGCKLIGKSGKMTPKNAAKLLKAVKAVKIPSGKAFEDYLKGQSVMVDDGENSVANWRKYFVNKRKRFVRFLESAIKLNQSISCSV